MSLFATKTACRVALTVASPSKVYVMADTYTREEGSVIFYVRYIFNGELIATENYSHSAAWNLADSMNAKGTPVIAVCDIFGNVWPYLP